MSHPLTTPEVLTRLHTGALFLTPNARSATALREAYDLHQETLGQTVWQSANILSWDQFTQSRYSDLITHGQESRLLLNAAQEQTLWREIIAADETQRRLAPPDALATLAASAWSLAHAYKAVPRLRSAATTHDSKTFATWADELQRRLDRNQFLTTAQLEATLEDHLRAATLKPVPALTLLSFNEITPAQHTLLLALRRSGTDIQVHHLEAQPTEAPLRASLILPDEREELIFAVRYARQVLEQDATATIALILPDVAADRPILEPLLREILTPELEDIAADPSSTPWEWSSGDPITQAVLVADALDLARWVRSPLPLVRIGALLLSPFLGQADHRDPLARFDANILQQTPLLRPELDVRSTLALTRDKHAPPEAAAFLNLIAEAASDLLAGNPSRTFAEWTESLRRLLHAAGWPGPRALTATEYQTTLAWDATLDLVATLDFAGRRVSFAEACDAVERQASTALVPPATRRAPIKILTAREAEAQTFTTTLILRCTDINWPPASAPNPLIDRTLQRNLAMPGVHPQQDAEAASDRLARLVVTSQTTLFLSAAQNANGLLRSSSLTSSLDIKPLKEDHLLSPGIPQSAVEIHTLSDDLPLPALPSMELSGGSRLLKLQAACGFLAFAEMRLGGREIGIQDAGFDALETGNVLHRALETFWRQIETQDNLRTLSHGARAAALTAAIDDAVNTRLRIHDSWDEAYLSLQKDRMCALLLKWLDFELERSPFTVQGNEERVSIDVGPLTLQLRMDRIDELPDGGFVLVDYKTGISAKPASWNSDRPEEPQLPLYSLLTDSSELRGITFAKIRAGEEMQWAGYASDTGIFPKKGTSLVDLPTEVDRWRTTLTQLAQDFHDGHTQVDPKNYAVNCKRCAQRLLCRLDVTSLMANAEEGNDAE